MPSRGRTKAEVTIWPGPPRFAAVSARAIITQSKRAPSIRDYAIVEEGTLPLPWVHYDTGYWPSDLFFLGFTESPYEEPATCVCFIEAIDAHASFLARVGDKMGRRYLRNAMP